jgi:hypothetical protein
MKRNMQQRRDQMLGTSDKDKSVSDTAFHSDLIREAFPKDRYGGAKAAIYAAYRYIAPKVAKQFTERRARAIWEGTARRIDAEESAVLRRAQFEEAKREYIDLQSRLRSLEAALAVADEAFHGPQMAAYREVANGLGGLDRARND